MSTIELSGPCVSRDYTGADLCLAVVASVFCWTILFAVSSTLYLGGIVSGFLLLFLLGYWFPTTPARIIGCAFMSLSAIFGFYKGVQSGFDIAWVPFYFACAGAVPLLWGFKEGVKTLSQTERASLKAESNDMVCALVLLCAGFMSECLFARVPYAGIILGSAGALIAGYVLGCIDIPLIEKTLVAFATLFGLALGLFLQLRDTNGVIVGVTVGTVIAFTAFCFGLHRAAVVLAEKQKNPQDEK